MAIIRYRPLSLLNDLQTEINSLFNQPGLSNENDNIMATSNWTPEVDIKDEKDHFVIFADIPGVDPKDIDVHMDNGVLTIKGEKHTESKKEENNYYRSERFSGVFYRNFRLPDTVDSDNVSAKTKNGVLEITIPKTTKTAVKKITVQ